MFRRSLFKLGLRKAKEEASKSEAPKKTAPTELPRQYTKANLTKQQEDDDDYTDMVQDYLQEALAASEAQSKEDDLIDLRSVANVARTATVSVSDDRVVQCMNSLYIDDQKKVSIMDNGAETCVLGKG